MFMGKFIFYIVQTDAGIHRALYTRTTKKGWNRHLGWKRGSPFNMVMTGIDPAE